MRTWTCQRSLGGVKCRAVNPARRQICQACGRRRPKRKRKVIPAYEIPYERYVEMYGECCGICGRVPKPTDKRQRLDRDRWHRGPLKDQPRGLLCWSCNKNLRDWMTPEWLSAASAYLERGR